MFDTFCNCLSSTQLPATADPLGGKNQPIEAFRTNNPNFKHKYTRCTKIQGDIGS